MKNNTMLSLGMLIKRNVKLFLKDKMTVFFSVLAPVIVLLIYVLFLGEIQVTAIEGMLPAELIENGTVTSADLHAIVNNWMIAGVMGVSCITVAVNANIMMVRDRSYGQINDVLASPVKRWVLYLSYIISCFVVTLCISLIVLAVSMIYLAATGGFMLSFLDVLAVLGITVLSTISSSCLTSLICGFIKSPSALATLNGIFCTAIGFFIGAYLPFGMLPNFVGWIGCFIPGSYSVGLFKNFFMNGLFEKMSDKLGSLGGENFLTNIMKTFSINIEFFGHEISLGWMVFALILSIVVLTALILILYANKKTNFFAQGRRVRRKKVKLSVDHKTK